LHKWHGAAVRRAVLHWHMLTPVLFAELHAA